MTDLWMFIGALAVAYLMPGPDMLLVMHVGAEEGRQRALAVAAGLAVARGGHVALAGIGLAALVAAVPMALVLLRLGGAAYLVWLAFGVLRASSTPARRGDGASGAAFRRGLVTNLLNPKALLFCSVLLPQFTDPARGAMAGQFLLLGAVLIGTGLAFDTCYALSGAGLRHWLYAYVQVQRRVFAALLVAFAFHLAMTAFRL